VADLLPTTSVGQVLITSRDIGWSEAAELVDVDLPTPAEATQFLLVRAGSDDQEVADQLTKLLGYLPLAMEQAAAYIQQVRCSLTSYLRRLERVPELTIEKGRARNYSATVATTWQVSVSRIRETPGAEALLEACAHLAPESIPRALFDQPLDELPGDAAVLTADPFALDEAVGALHRFSLIKASEETLTLHRLLQDALRTRMNPTTAANRSAWVVRLLARTYPKDGCRDPATWPDCERLLPHALEAAAHAERLHAANVANGELLNRAGGYLFGRGRYREAVDLGQRALTLTEHDLGENHPTVGICNHSLGVRLFWAGDLGDAQHHLERALAIKEATFGSDHDQTALTLTHLGAVLRSLGRLSDAQRHLERALAINEAILGANHRETAITLTHLGGAVLRDLGRLSDAQRHLERALAIDEATLGSDHYETAFTLTYLGAVLQDQGQLDVAQQHLERALAIDEAALGPDHHETAITLTHLGAVLQHRGSKSDGKLYLERAHRILQGTRGVGHPDLHAVQRCLAMRS
jgi:tetratricopeptide (TPR) repeat protein